MATKTGTAYVLELVCDICDDYEVIAAPNYGAARSYAFEQGWSLATDERPDQCPKHLDITDHRYFEMPRALYFGVGQE